MLLVRAQPEKNKCGRHWTVYGGWRFMSRRRYTGAGIYPCRDCTRCLHTFGSSPAPRRTYIQVFVARFRGKSTVGKKKRRPRPRRSEGRNLKLGGLSPRTVLLIRLLTKSNYPVRLTDGVCGAEELRLRRDSSTPINYRSCCVRGFFPVH